MKTPAERQQKRREQLHKIALRLGYESWYKLATAILKDEVKLIKTEPAK